MGFQRCRRAVLAAVLVSGSVGTDDCVGCSGLPDFVIIGSQKAGTTFLRTALASHPRLLTSRDGEGLSQEVHFFDGFETCCKSPALAHTGPPRCQKWWTKFHLSCDAGFDALRAAYARAFPPRSPGVLLFDDTPRSGPRITRTGAPPADTAFAPLSATSRRSRRRPCARSGMCSRAPRISSCCCATPSSASQASGARHALSRALATARA